jgi:hypothetical protein
MNYKKNNMNTDRKNGGETKRARVTSGSRNPEYGERKRYIVHTPNRLKLRKLLGNPENATRPPRDGSR